MNVIDEAQMGDSTNGGIKSIASSTDKIYALNGYGHLHSSACEEPLG